MSDDQDSVISRAADPSTPLAELAQLAYEHPEARVTIAANPSTYEDLLAWLSELGDPRVDEALRMRAPASEPVVSLDAVDSSPSPSNQLLDSIRLIPRMVKVAAGLGLSAIIFTILMCVGLTAAAQGRLADAVSNHDERQAEADAAAEQQREEEVGEEPIEEPVETPPALPPVSAGGHQIEWTNTTSLGYSITSKVTWGAVVRGTEGDSHPSSAGFTLGSGCGFEPTKDAYVAGVWTVTNSTETYALALGSQMSVQGRVSTPGVSVELEWNTSSGPNCGFSTLPYAASIESNSEIESGQSIASPIFIIIRNYYSPTYPEGDVGDLVNISVRQGFTGGVSAPLG